MLMHMWFSLIFRKNHGKKLSDYHVWDCRNFTILAVFVENKLFDSKCDSRKVTILCVCFAGKDQCC